MLNKNKKVLLLVLIAGVTILGFLIARRLWKFSKSNSKDESVSGVKFEQYVKDDQKMNNQSGLKIEDLTIGDGEEAKEGMSVEVNYLGYLTDGKKFDSSYDRDEPFKFTLGAGQVIKGWDLGVVGMKVGGKRKLVIPSSLGYGQFGYTGVIPPNATLVFEIELLSVSQSSQ